MTGEEKFNLVVDNMEDYIERKRKLEEYWHTRMHKKDDPYEFDLLRNNWIQAKSLRLGVSECLNKTKMEIDRIEREEKES